MSCIRIGRLIGIFLWRLQFSRLVFVTESIHSKKSHTNQLSNSYSKALRSINLFHVFESGRYLKLEGSFAISINYSTQNGISNRISHIKGASLLCKILLCACQRPSIQPLANQCYHSEKKGTEMVPLGALYSVINYCLILLISLSVIDLFVTKKPQKTCT